MTLKWEINVKFPNIEIPQKHTLIVKLSDSMRPEEILNLVFSGGIEEIENLDRDAFPIVASVDFIDECLGEELLGIVAKWNDSLKLSISDDRLIQYARKNKNKIANIINYVPIVIFMVCGFFILKEYLLELDCSYIGDISIQYMVGFLQLVTAVILICYVFKKVFYELAKMVYNNLNEYGEVHIFNITNGDKKEQEKIKSRNSRKKSNVFFNLVLTCVLNIICGIVTGFIIN